MLNTNEMRARIAANLINLVGDEQGTGAVFFAKYVEASASRAAESLNNIPRGNILENRPKFLEIRLGGSLNVLGIPQVDKDTLLEKIELLSPVKDLPNRTQEWEKLMQDIEYVRVAFIDIDLSDPKASESRLDLLKKVYIARLGRNAKTVPETNGMSTGSWQSRIEGANGLLRSKYYFDQAMKNPIFK